MRATALALLLLPACSSTVVPAATPGDAAAPADVRPGGPDASVGPDVAPADDAGPAVDVAPLPTDVVVPQGDTPTPGADVVAPEMALAGRWRVVRYRFVRADGSIVTLTDENAPYTDPGTGAMAMVRTNGVVTLTPSRLAIALSALASDHIYSTGVMSGRDEFSATAFAVPGLLDTRAGAFELPGGQTTYEVRAIGPDALRMRFAAGPDNYVELARATTAPTLARLNAVGGAELLRPALQRPMTHPRAALLWVRPGVRGLIETNGVALSFMGNWAPFPVTLADAPPMEARFTVSGVELAAAMIAVYDDRNDNRAMELAGGDALRGLSQITIAWRGDAAQPPDPTFARTAFVDLQPGYQLAWRARDVSTGGVALIPFDNTRPISPDAPVSPTELDPLTLESTWR